MPEGIKPPGVILREEGIKDRPDRRPVHRAKTVLKESDESIRFTDHPQPTVIIHEHVREPEDTDRREEREETEEKRKFNA